MELLKCYSLDALEQVLPMRWVAWVCDFGFAGKELVVGGVKRNEMQERWILVDKWESTCEKLPAEPGRWWENANKMDRLTLP
jgi:hypothetical protein